MTQPEPECPSCGWLDALAARLVAPDGEYRDESALADVRVLRKRHEPECSNPRGGAE